MRRGQGRPICPNFMHPIRCIRTLFLKSRVTVIALARFRTETRHCFAAEIVPMMVGFLCVLNPVG